MDKTLKKNNFIQKNRENEKSTYQQFIEECSPNV
jgi:hypothetical protein